MRAKIIIVTSVVSLLAALLLLERSATSSVALSFAGYDTNGWATFALTNHTRFYLSHSHPRIQLHTPAGWTNYYGIDTLMCRLIGPLSAHEHTTLSAALPSGSLRWRAVVQYRVIPVYEGGWRTILESALAAVRLGPRTNDITLVTQEFVR